MTIKQTSFCTFVLEFKNGSVAVNPVKKSSEDIALFSAPTSGYLNYESDAGLIVKNAGEFEIKDIFINGRKTRKEESFVYTISADDLTIGVISMISDDQIIPTELFETADILLIGAGSGPFMSPEKASNFVNKVAPSIAIFFGFREQAGSMKEVGDILDTLEEAKKEISGLQIAEKSLKLDQDYVDGLENTVSYYFE